MSLPFTVQQFFNVFKSYNLAIWPSQLLAYILAFLAIFLLVKKSPISNKIIFLLLAVLWFWNGITYHLLFFSKINPAATIFGILFVIQGLLFIFFAGKIKFKFSTKIKSIIGLVFIVFSMLIYPILGKYFGHSYPGMPMFGVAPCPTTIFTLGFLLLTGNRPHWHLAIIPITWSIIGGSAAFKLQVPQDYGLIVAGIVSLVLFITKTKKS